MPRGGGGGGRDEFFDFEEPADFGDPFDDPYLTPPLGNTFDSSMFDPNPGSFGDSTSVYWEHQSQTPDESEGPVIEELTYYDERNEEEEEELDTGIMENYGYPGDRSWLTEPYVEYPPDDEAEEGERERLVYRSDYNRAIRTQSQVREFSFQNSTVTYGDTNGAYYTSSTTRMAGSDRVMMEEKKEAGSITGQAKHKISRGFYDKVTMEEKKEAYSITGQAKHRISRGIYDKGHSFTRKLKSESKVETMQTLHNLNQGYSRSGQNGQAKRGWALPSTEPPPNPKKMKPLTSSRGKP